MDYFSSLTYGVIQGLFEFLPVSSSGHLALLPLALKISDPGVFFDLMMHVGTTLALILYFRKRLLQIFTTTFHTLTGKTPLAQLSTQQKIDYFYFWHVFAATIVTILCILLIKPFADRFARHSGLIALNLIIFGVVLYLVDRFSSKKHDQSPWTHFHWPLVLLVGSFQAIAIFPGVSRSGITLTAAMLLGLSRSASAEFIFLLSIPVILLGALKAIGEMIQDPSHLQVALGPMIFGAAVAFVVGLLTIHYFLKWLKKRGTTVFVIYRILLGAAILSLLP